MILLRGNVRLHSKQTGEDMRAIQKMKMVMLALSIGIGSGWTMAAEQKLEIPPSVLNQKTTILLAGCGGESLESLLEDIRKAFPGPQKIVGLAADLRNWEIEEAPVDQFIIQNIQDPYVVESGQKLPADGKMFKPDVTIPHLTLLGPESTWWKPNTPQIPLGNIDFEDYLTQLSACEAFKFTLEGGEVMGRWIVAKLKPTESTIEKRSQLIAPYLELYQKAMSFNISPALTKIIAQLDRSTMEKMVQARRVGDKLWAKINSSPEGIFPIIRFFDKLTSQGISPYSYGHWFAEEKYPMSSSVISLMKVISLWKPHLSLMPVVVPQTRQVGEIIERLQQSELLKDAGENLERVKEILEKYQGSEISFNSVAIQQDGYLVVQNLK